VEIITYWNVETLYRFFNGVAAIVGGSDFLSALRVVVLLGLALGVFAWWKQRLYEWTSDKVMLLVLLIMFSSLKSNILITDKTNLEPPRVVNNVPWALAVPVFLANGIGTWLVYKYEAVFNIPNEISLANGDMAFGHRILKNVNRAKITNAPLQADLMQFIKECTVNDVRDGAIDDTNLLKGVNSWNTMWDNTSPARFVTLGMLTGNQQLFTCTDAAKNAGALTLKTRVDAATLEALTINGRAMFPRSTSDTVAAGLYANAIGTSFGYILGVTSSASDALKQGMFNNLWKEAGTNLPAMLGDPARVSEVTALMTTAAAARAADGANSSTSMLAQEAIPHIRNVIQAFLLGFFPILTLMMFILNNDERLAYLKTYIKLLAGVELIPVAFAILNHVSIIWLTKKAAALKIAENAGVSFQMTDVFDATLQDEQAMLGSMLIGVMVLMLMLIGATQLSGVIDRTTAAFSGAANSTAGELARGNFSAGNVSLDNASAGNGSFFKYDGNMALSGGGMSMQMANGGTITSTLNGTSAYSELQNAFAARFTQSANRGSDNTSRIGSNVVATQGQQWTDRQADSASLTKNVGASRERGANQLINKGSTIDLSGGYNTNAAQRNEESVQDARVSRFGNQESAARDLSSRLGGDLSARQYAPRSNAGGGKGNPANAQASPNQPNPSANGSPRPNAGQGMPFAGGFNVGGSIGGSYGASATNARDWSTQSNQSGSKSADQSFNYGVRAGATTLNQTGESSSQVSRDGRDATRSNVAEQAKSSDIGFRKDLAFDENANYANSRQAGLERSLDRDKGFLKKVADSEGLSVMGMMIRGDGYMKQAMENYFDSKIASNIQPPNTFNSGSPIPTRPSIDAIRSSGERLLNPQALDKKDKDNISKTGSKGTRPVAADLRTNPLIENARQATARQALGPRAVEIPAREQGIPIKDIVGESKDIGSNPMSVNGEAEKILGRGVTQGAENAWNALRGKSGIPNPTQKQNPSEPSPTIKTPEEN
jgi:conjugal transfer mating pair stabilization protein TraG